MNRSLKILALIGVLLLALAAAPIFAQSDSGTPAQYPVNTVTVTGYGTVHGTPDVATVDVGVDVTKATVSDAFTQANTTIQKVIDAIKGLGIAADDIQTSNLSVYTSTTNNPETGKDEAAYTVSNTVHVVVRDISKVENVIDTAIGAGATNLYGLSFDIQDHSTLESQARQLAMQDAAKRAGEYASLANAKLGDVVVISEQQTGGAVPVYALRNSGSAGAGGAVVAPGQTEVDIQVSVTYQLVH